MENTNYRVIGELLMIKITAVPIQKEKDYDAELRALGISDERIRHYGFAFEGKKVLIGDKI